MGIFSWLSELFTESPPEPLVLGAELKCPCGTSHSYLYLETDEIDINNLPQANVEDCKAFYNISPFGTCRRSIMGAYEFPCEWCMNLAEQWENSEPQTMMSNGKEIITTKSTLVCLSSGKEIKPVTSGQEGTFAKQLILYAEMEQKYPGLLEILMEPYGSLYLNDGMLEMAFQFMEEQMALHDGELSLELIHDGTDPEWKVIKVILERLIPDCKTWTCYDFQQAINAGVWAGMDKIDEETKKEIYERKPKADSPSESYEYMMILDYDKLKLLQAGCLAKEEKIQTNAFDRWLEEHREFTSKLEDGLTQAICAALLCSSMVTVTPLEDQFLLPGSTSGNLIPQSGAGGAGLPANIGSGYQGYPIIGAIPGPVQGEPALPEGVGGGGAQYTGGTASIPDKAKAIAQQIKNNNGTPPKGYKGGKVYQNNPVNGGQKLPAGQNYREYDVNPYIKGQGRGVERIVIGDDGSVWYTNDHYRTFQRME
ncbi:MAG: DUF4280 domain-containing protein [Lachnospiraceae bacterium]|nr:DUF4280 domain-containing protein [Lachnospiraceae bacterium]